MSVVGIDLGSQSTKIGVVRNKGVDIITNEVSNRSTPTLVAFGSKNRFIGEGAKTQETSNLKNTVNSFKRLTGRSLTDPDAQTELDFNTAKLLDVEGQAGAEVSYLGKTQQFTSTQLVSMFLSKIKATVQDALAGTAAAASKPDVVLSVPPWFTDCQRRALLDAVQIAGLNPLRLMNDTTAIALGYGITKADLPSREEKPKRLCFIDIGYSDYTASVVEFREGELRIKSTACDRHLGGRDFDSALVKHLGAEFKDKFKVDISANPKAYSRTLAAIEKLKKVLSANSMAPMSIESVMDDKDVSAMVKREDFEEMSKHLLDRITLPVQQALAEAGMKPEDIDHIEMVGGCTRIPAIKNIISGFFGKGLSFTLNQDEAVARGCAFASAILSPSFRVRNFDVRDVVPYPIDFTWEQAPDVPDEETSLTVFNRGNFMPSSKILTFYRKSPFDLEARYAAPEQLPGRANPLIGRFSVKNVQPDPSGDFMICKLTVRHNLHGIVNIESGYYVEEVEVEEPIDENGKPTEAPKESDKEVKTRKVKKHVPKGNLPVVSGTASLSEDVKHRWAEMENEMHAEDKLVADTENKKNELESFIYETRDKLEGVYASFGNDEEKGKLREKLTASEDWLYEEGDDTTKSAYTAKMEEILAVLAPIKQRKDDKDNAEREAKQKAEEEAAAKKKAEEEAKKQADQEAAAAAAAAASIKKDKPEQEQNGNNEDVEMKGSAESESAPKSS